MRIQVTPEGIVIRPIGAADVASSSQVRPPRTNRAAANAMKETTALWRGYPTLRANSQN